MIEALLVANRGEIACRIIRTARRMGIRTVAVYSDADAAGRHVREADAAIHIGAAAARESYLHIGRLIDAARAAGVQAIHPGYGFLAENAQFAEACKDAGLIFVGPPASAIAAMGSKSAAKARMRAAGVPVLPGYEGPDQDIERLESEARRLGLPLMIKPAAGGGGKGMRIIQQESALREALLGARRVAESSFGDGALMLERYLAAPRHVEVQIFADEHGHCVHLGDRDCSIQRRHQKVIEEAPAPGVPDEVRAAMQAAAIQVARAIGYVGAGTVEFLLEGREFFFMEMNTRLQVEHTVTEAITGLDLVEWQLLVASGHPLPLTQDEIRFSGHAMEARVCAEDPERDFLPSAGRLKLMRWPAGESIRVDAGFEAGDFVPDAYDSLLGKVIAWAPTREQAAARLARALDETYCIGVHTNERWLRRILLSSRFRGAQLSTGFLQNGADDLAAPKEPPADALVLAALAAHAQQESDPADPWSATDGFVPNLGASVDHTLAWGERSARASVAFSAGKPVAVKLDGADELPVSGLHVVREATGLRSAPAPDGAAVGDIPTIVEGTLSVQVQGRRIGARYAFDGPSLHLWTGGEHFELTLEDPRTAEYEVDAAEGGLTTPLPGVVVAVHVQVGQTVKAGDVLMVIEAMKMEHSITAPYAGTVQALYFVPGDKVPEGSALLELARDGH